MSEALQSVAASPQPPVPGVAFWIAPEDIDQHWPDILEVLHRVEAYSQLVSAAEIHAELVHGRSHIFGVLDRNRGLLFAVARPGCGPQGTVCSVWLYLAIGHDDDGALCALFAVIDAFARSQNATVLETYAPPWLAKHIETNLGGKITASVIEQDLRGSTN